MCRNSTKRISLSLKINLLIVSVIILVTWGLVAISYRVYAKRITDHFISESESAALSAKEELIPDSLNFIELSSKVFIINILTNFSLSTLSI